jgi:hypothetical protein
VRRMSANSKPAEIVVADPVVNSIGKVHNEMPISSEITLHSSVKPWTVEDSEALYQIRGWGEPYFSVNAAGHVTVSPKGDRGGSLDLLDLVNALKQRDIHLTILGCTEASFQSNVISTDIWWKIWCALADLISLDWRQALNQS